MPSQGLHPQSRPRDVGHLAASRHPWLVAGAQLVEVALLVPGGSAWTHVSQAGSLLAPQHGFWRVSCPHPSGSPCPHLTHPRAASCAPHAAAAARQGGQPRLGQAAGNLRSKIGASGFEALLAPLPAPLSEGPHCLPAPTHPLGLVGISISSSTGPAAAHGGASGGTKYKQ